MSEPNERVSAAVRAALLRKYRLLCTWRSGKDRSFHPHAPDAPDANGAADGLASRDDLRALSEEFPGALRELDRLGLPELQRRTRALERDDHEAWMAWIASYHAIMRDVLADRRDGGPRARPPEGKLSVAVLREVALRFDRPESEIAATLFPARVRRTSPDTP